MQDELVDYRIKHGRFPDNMRRITLPSSYWPDLIVLMWVCLLGIPALLAALYLAWVGAWLTLGVILVAVFVGEDTHTNGDEPVFCLLVQPCHV